MLIEQRISEKGIETINKVDIAIARIREFEPPEGYWVGFSGGKDSVVIKDLVQKAGVRATYHYNLTTVDPPEIVQFIKTFPDVVIERPEKTMWQLIVENGMPPLRQMRYCCRILKERGGEGRFKILGLRWTESASRKEKRSLIETCFEHQTRTLNPIIEWTDKEVWEYIKTYEIAHCSLYSEGWKRLGCVCCPNADRTMRLQAKRWPKLAAAYKRACVRAFDKAIKDGKKRTWANGEEMFEWWISGQPGAKETDQTVMFE